MQKDAKAKDDSSQASDPQDLWWGRPALLGLHVLQTAGPHVSSFKPPSEGPGEADAHCVDEETEVCTAVGAGMGWGDGVTNPFSLRGRRSRGLRGSREQVIAMLTSHTAGQTGPGGGSAQSPGATKNTAGL